MTSSGEQSAAEEREAQLSQLRKRMAKAARRRDMVRYAELRAEHDRLKDAHVMASHAEAKAAMRAQQPQERVRWKLPAGFGTSPLAAERARQPRRGGAVQVPAGGLRPWRGGWSPASERIWRP